MNLLICNSEDKISLDEIVPRITKKTLDDEFTTEVISKQSSMAATA